MIRGLRQKLWSMYLYPEIGSERTLGKVILEIIALSGREITLSDASKDAFSPCFCKDRRIAELWTGDHERIFISHFSMRGVRMAYHVARDLHEVARAVES